MTPTVTEEDSPVFGVRATDFGSWIDFNFSATSTNRANQIALILQQLLNTHAQAIGRAVVRLALATAVDRSHGSRNQIRTSGNPPLITRFLYAGFYCMPMLCDIGATETELYHTLP